MNKLHAFQCIHALLQCEVLQQGFHGSSWGNNRLSKVLGKASAPLVNDNSGRVLCWPLLVVLCPLVQTVGTLVPVGKINLIRSKMTFHLPCMSSLNLWSNFSPPRRQDILDITLRTETSPVASWEFQRLHGPFRC